MGIIGISGKLNSGKDTVGEIVQIISASPHFTDEAVVSFIGRPQLNPKWENKKFADKLKDIVCVLLGCTKEQLEDREFKEKELGEEWWYYKVLSGNLLNPIELKSYLDNKEEYHKDVLIKSTPRLLLQLIGTECGRQIIHPNIWVNALMSEYKEKETFQVFEGMPVLGTFKTNKPNWIITDMRFPNELKAVEDKGGITIRVNRDYILTGGPEDPKDQHESETALDNAEFDYVIENDGELVDLVSKVREIMSKENLW